MNLKKALFLVLLTALIAAVATAETTKTSPETYGEGLSLTEVTPIAKITADPAAFAGQVVRVEGKVTGVCAMKGCWIELASKENDKVRVKVEDDVIVFPQEAAGQWAAAEGEVTVRDMPREQWVAWQRHLAEERGETYDDSEVGDGPFQLVQIEGRGAEIR